MRDDLSLRAGKEGVVELETGFVATGLPHRTYFTHWLIGPVNTTASSRPAQGRELGFDRHVLARAGFGRRRCSKGFV
jgi:hypothetical protein